MKIISLMRRVAKILISMIRAYNSTITWDQYCKLECKQYETRKYNFCC